MKPSFVVVGALALIAGCGSQPRELRSAGPQPALSSTQATASLERPFTPTGLIPAPSGPDDQRSPIERFVGVPDNAAAAEEWSWTSMQHGVAECMTNRGWEYTIQAFDSRSTAGENATFVASLSTERQAAYVNDRWGTAGHVDASCEAEASRRSFVMNAFPQAYEGMRRSVDADPAIVAGLALLGECVGGNPHVASPKIRESCLESTGYSATLREVTERVESKFVEDHSSQLNSFKENRP